MLTAIETTATLTKNHQLELDEHLPSDTPSRVRVIVLFDESPDFNEKEWMQAVPKNDAFDFLGDEAEDIYSLVDGKPLS